MSETFGRYQLLRKLATGGMGEVFLARQKGPVGFEKLLVVKRILPHLSEDEDFIQMFFDEARIAAPLNHPNIAQIFDLGQVDDTYFIAMEYVHGESVRSLNVRANSEKGGLPLGLKCRIIADAAAGLDFAHRAKNPQGMPLALIHRDVSPQNVLVGFNGCVKLIDFGVAKAAGKVSTTMTGAIKGKYAYMSPEQARGEELDHRSDIFGLGVVFYELLTSGRLFKRNSEKDTLRAVVGDAVAPPSTMLKGIPKAIDHIVLKALAKKRADRYQSAAEMQLALEDFLVQQRLPATTAHLSGFMRELFPESQHERFVEDPTLISESRAVSSRSGRETPSQTRERAEQFSSRPTKPELPRALKDRSQSQGPSTGSKGRATGSGQGPSASGRSKRPPSK